MDDKNKKLEQIVGSLLQLNTENQKEFARAALVLTRKALEKEAPTILQARNQSDQLEDLVFVNTGHPEGSFRTTNLEVYGSIASEHEKEDSKSFCLAITCSPPSIEYREIGEWSSENYKCDFYEMTWETKEQIDELLNKYNTPKVIEQRKTALMIDEQLEQLKALVVEEPSSNQKELASQQFETVVRTFQKILKPDKAVLSTLRYLNMKQCAKEKLIFEQNDKSWYVGYVKKSPVYQNKTKYIEARPVVLMSGNAIDGITDIKDPVLTKEPQLTMAISQGLSFYDYENFQEDGRLRFEIYCPHLQFSFSDMDSDDVDFVRESCPSFDPDEIPMYLSYDYDVNKYYVECDATECPEHAAYSLCLHGTDFCDYPKRISNDELNFLISKCQEYIREKEGLSIEEYAEKLCEMEEELVSEKE